MQTKRGYEERREQGGSMRRRWWAALGSGVIACAAMAGPPQKDRGPGAAEKVDNSAFETSVRAALLKLSEEFATTARPGDLVPRVEQLFDLSVAYTTPAGDGALLRDVNALRREIKQMAMLKPEESAAARKVITANPKLGRAVAMAVEPGTDNVGNAYAVLRLLAEKFPDRVLDKPRPADAKPGPAGRGRDDKSDLSNLVAAFCVVFDGPLNEKGKASDKPAAIESDRVEKLFEYFSSNAGKLEFGPGTPTDLLTYVVSVDPRVTIDDLNWAMKGYHGNKAVGKLYQTIVYDTNAFKRGTPKKVEQAPGGVTLQNIRKYGGVCVEQALFASNVGKAIGVPAVSVTGRGSDVGHAWVGYLKSTGSNKYEWDFDEGRYKEYRDLRGSVVDPRTGKPIPDGYVGLTAGLLGSEAVREQATALLDASDRLELVEGTKLAYPPGRLADMPEPKTTARALGLKTRLELIETALRAVPAERRGWEDIAALAQSRRLSPEDLKLWSERVLELCADDYPDFAFAALAPMVRSVQNTEEQDKLWEWTAGRFNKRKDLTASAIMMRADMWQQAKQPQKAWDLYNDVIERFPNDGQIIVEALGRAEQFLLREKKEQAVVDLYAKAWGRITKPKEGAGQFTAASNYVVVGKAYAARLTKAGKPVDAKKVNDAIQQVLDK
jgi:hypothetical protein